MTSHPQTIILPSFRFTLRPCVMGSGVRVGEDLSYLSTTVMVWILNVLVGKGTLRRWGLAGGIGSLGVCPCRGQ